mmetsp:Transcript_10648/g.23062  ORF Transcript_10648/g.23062 Transcript_10648/m.23062 type:complete len:231 (-) Transcript_10648:182-874(-)
MRSISKLFFAGLALSAAPTASGCDSTLDVVLASSGGPDAGFDNFGKDFDILRALVLLTGLEGSLGKPGDGGLTDITVFAPWDDAFFRLAKQLSDFVDDDANEFNPSGYDEEGAFSYIAGVLTELAGGTEEGLKELVTNILLYHVADEAIVFRRLAEKGHKKTTVTTLFEGNEIPIVMAMPTSQNSMRMKMKHNAAGSEFRFPKIQNKQFDIKTCNGRLNVIKDVLIPLEV